MDDFKKTAIVNFSDVSWLNFYSFFKDYLFIFRGEGREKERERNINVSLPLTRPLLGTSPATQACADWGLNWLPFGSQACTQSTEPHQPGLNFHSQSSIFLLFLSEKEKDLFSTFT